MKVLVVLCVFLVSYVSAKSVITKEDMQALLKLSEECKKITGVDGAIQAKARAGDFVDDPKLKQQLLCVNKKLGIQDDSGKFIFNKIKGYINKYTNNMDKTNEITQKCFKDLDTPEKSAFEATKCMQPLIS